VPRVDQVVLCYGARTASSLAGVEDFRQSGVAVRISTDDGSAGSRGFVTGPLRELLAEETALRRRIVCCGPEPMMAAVAEIARQGQVPAQVSLETPMACGIGICFTCVAPVRDAAGRSDYHRTCVEGPVFDAACIDWSRGISRPPTAISPA
jgi:dihydroorotate dehydrogenase electron transfer subunit